jgi:hypothetical protein
MRDLLRRKLARLLFSGYSVFLSESRGYFAGVDQHYPDIVLSKFAPPTFSQTTKGKLG